MVIVEDEISPFVNKGRDAIFLLVILDGALLNVGTTVFS